MPSPQISSKQFKLHPSFEALLPSSHSSPSCVNPSPQSGPLHCDVQLSDSFALPSSHASPASTTPSPHSAFWQYGRQKFGSNEFCSPRSHSSPASTTPFPQSAACPVRSFASSSTYATPAMPATASRRARCRDARRNFSTMQWSVPFSTAFLQSARHAPAESAQHFHLRRAHPV